MLNRIDPRFELGAWCTTTSHLYHWTTEEVVMLCFMYAVICIIMKYIACKLDVLHLFNKPPCLRYWSINYFTTHIHIFEFEDKYTDIIIT